MQFFVNVVAIFMQERFYHSLRVHNGAYLGKSATTHVFSKAIVEFSRGAHTLSPQTVRRIESLLCIFEIHNTGHHENAISFPKESMHVRRRRVSSFKQTHLDGALSNLI